MNSKDLKRACSDYEHALQTVCDCNDRNLCSVMVYDDTDVIINMSCVWCSLDELYVSVNDGDDLCDAIFEQLIMDNIIDWSGDDIYMHEGYGPNVDDFVCDLRTEVCEKLQSACNLLTNK